MCTSNARIVSGHDSVMSEGVTLQWPSVGGIRTCDLSLCSHEMMIGRYLQALEHNSIVSEGIKT